MSNIPIILLALANENTHKNRKLNNLETEASGILNGLKDAIDEQLCEVVTLKNTTIDDILSTFRNPEYKNRISIFHYAGHADGYQLLLETLDGKNKIARGEGLVSFLSRQDSLQLIFLNGCSTEQQAEDMINAGVHAVIGTSQSINDTIAMELASRFYKSLGLGTTLKTAWNDAIDEIKISHQPSEWRSLAEEEYALNTPSINDRYPWELYIREGASQVNQWNLPDASDNPLFRLPKIDEHYYQSLPYPPFRYLKYYRQQDAATFFGRGYETRDLYEALQQKQNSITLLYGKSGVGKSSLLNAGIIPRIEKQFDVLYARRDEKIGLLKTIEKMLTNEEQTEADLQSLWQQREEKSKKPLLFILDQVEEYETKATHGIDDELGDLVQQIQQLFDSNGSSSDSLNGRIMLSYRKEYHPDIVKKLKEKHLAYSSIYLEPLSRKGVIEAVQGLAKHETTKNFYQYSVEGLNNADKEENDLAAIIADDLLEDKNSPVASLLQIHLSKLWNKINPTKGQKVRFTVKDYQGIGKSNLNDFFQEQMAILEDTSPEAVNSGLVLELLNQHTTEFGTARPCETATIERQYQHYGDIQALQHQLVNSYLLSKDSEHSTVLAHDTLGVIVLSNYASSDRPAQRTRRILENKTANRTDKENTNNILDEHDLAEVEAGKSSIKQLSNDEIELIDQSILAREQREKAKKRRRRLGISAVATIAGVAVIATVFFFKADTEKTRALTQIENANNLIGYVQSDLREKLQEVNRLDIMDDVQSAIDKYSQDSSNVVIGTTDALILKNKRQIIKNTVDQADSLFQKGMTMEALNIYKASLNEIKTISNKIPNDLKYLSNIGVLNLKIASVYTTHHEYKKAFPLIIESLELANNLSNQEPENKLFKRDVVSSYESLADFYKDTDDYSKAIINYQKGLSISQELLNSDPDSTDYKRLNILFLKKTASTYSKINAVSEAINTIDALSDEEKSTLDPALLKSFEEKIKNIKRSCGKKSCLDMALESHLKELELSEKLSADNVNNNIFYRDLINIYNAIAIVYIAKEDLDNASIYYLKFIKGSKEILRRNPLHIEHKFLLAQAYEGLADISRRKKEFNQSRELYEKSVLLVKELLKTNPNSQDWKQYLQALTLMYEGLDTSEKANILFNSGINKF